MTVNLVSTYGPGFDRNIKRLPQFNGDELFYIFDLWDDTYLSDVIKDKGHPGALLSCTELFVHADHLHGIPFLGIPLWLMREARQWSARDFDHEQKPDTVYSFNFMANRAQYNRSLMIKLIEIGRYTDFQYTWSGLGRNLDMSPIIKEMNSLEETNPVATSDFRNKILSPIELGLRFLDHSSTKLAYANNGRIAYDGNKWSWDHFLHDMFYRSCVALISETCNFQKLTHASEKTLYAFYGLNFPIWVGPYGAARAWQKIGLDVFDDVIDHSYQWYPTLIERCYWALELNKRLLGDLDLAKSTRQKHLSRLLRNRQLVLEDRLGKYCVEQIDQFDIQYQEAAKAIKHIFDTTQSNMTVVRDQPDRNVRIKEFLTFDLSQDRN